MMEPETDEIARRLRGESEYEKGAPDSTSTPPARDKDMEVLINGHSGPTVRFQIGLMVIVNAVIATVGIGAAAALMRADVEQLKVKNQAMESITNETLQRVIELKTNVIYLTDEIRYYRDRTDRLSDKERGK